MSTTKSAWNTTGVQPNLEGGYDSWPGTTTYEPEGVPDPVWTAPASSYPAGTPESEYEAAMTVPVGTDPLSLGTTGALGGIYESGGQGALANQAQGLVSGLIGAGGDIGGYGPQTAAGQAGRAGLTSMILEGGLDPSDFRTELGQNVQDQLGGVIGDQGYMAATPMTAEVQGALGGVIGQQGQRPAHEATQQAQQQYDALIQQGAQRPLSTSEQAMLQQLEQTIGSGGQLPAHQMVQQAQTQLQDLMVQGQSRQLSPSELAMVQQLEQTIASGGRLDQSTLAQTSEQTLQDIIRASASAVAGQGGTLPQSALAQTSEQALQNIIQQGWTQSELGVQSGQQIADLLANQGRLPEDLQREAMQLEAARSPLDALRQAQMAQGAAALADRGLVGSGAGREYLEGLEERLAPQYTQAAQQIAEQRRQAEDQRYSQALGLGAQRAGQIENLRQQGLQSAIGEAGRQTAQQEQLQQQILQSALGQAGQQTAQQEQLEQAERQQALGQAGQYGLGLGQQGQQQQQFGISQSQQLGTQQEQMRDARLSQAMQQTGQYGLGLAGQGQQQQQFAIGGQQQLGAQQEQRQDQNFQAAMQMGQALGLSREEMQTTRLGQAMQLAGSLSEPEAAANRESYIQGLMMAEGITEPEARAQDQRMQWAVQQATGMDAQRVQNLLSTASTVNDYQAMLSDVALRSLDMNQDWHRFLAEFGLQREQVMEAMQMGRANAVVQLLDLYARTGQTTSTGYVPFDPDIARRFD